MLSPDHDLRDAARPVSGDSQETSALRTYDFLMKKWEQGQAFKNDRTRAKRTKHKQNNNAITQAEHDRIYQLYHTGTMTQTELSRRFGRSVGSVCRIVNGNHPLSTHD